MATIDTSILDRVLPEYKKISEAPEYDNPEVRYKSIDPRSGDIFLIANPCTWIEVSDEKGRTILRRPKPALEMTYSEAQSIEKVVTASFKREARGYGTI